MKLLVACSSPFGIKRGNSWEPIPEIPFEHLEGLVERLSRLPYAVEIDWLYGVYLYELHQHLQKTEPDILHLIVHGTPNGTLIFEHPERGGGRG